MEHVLVTGGAGFIGSHFVKRILAADDVATVTVLDALTYAGHIGNLGTAFLSPKLTFVHGNILDAELVDDLMAKHTAVVHFAAESHVDRSLWVGHPAHAQMVTAAAADGYDLTAHRGVQMTPGLLEWADTVLAMDTGNLTELCAFTDEVTAPKLGLYLGDRDVPDPWGKEPEAFANVVRLIEDGAPRHLP